MPSSAKNSDFFYNNMKPILLVEQLSKLDDYQLLPDDWVLLITDVIDSSKAIALGKYQTVNIVGVSGITAIKNISGKIDLPFQFGGDGATIAVPASLKEISIAALQKLQAYSKRMFDIELRIGSYSIQQIRQQGYEICVQKFQMSEGNIVAFFSGNGIEYAENLLKGKVIAQQDQFATDNHKSLTEDNTQFDNSAESPNLEGLSCRWELFSTQKGKVVSFMIKIIPRPNQSESEQLNKIFTNLKSILGDDLQLSNPVSLNKLRIKRNIMHLYMETMMVQMSLQQKNIFDKLISILSGWSVLTLIILAEKLNFTIGRFNPNQYKKEMVINSDYIKYDGILRAVLDISNDDYAKIEAWLEQGWQDRKWIYGIHHSENALITCYLQNLASSQHVHFIDGDKGGFASASIGFKVRLTTWLNEISKG